MSQEKAILRHLARGNTLTPLQALKLYGTLRLGARIYDLRADGHHIGSRMVNKGGKRVAQYYMVKA